MVRRSRGVREGYSLVWLLGIPTGPSVETRRREKAKQDCRCGALGQRAARLEKTEIAGRKNYRAGRTGPGCLGALVAEPLCCSSCSWSCWNCAFSVDPASAVVEECPPEMP